MADMSLTVFDMAVLFVVGVSALLALARGMVRESLSIVAWVIAGLIAFVAFPEVRPAVGDFIANVWVGDAVALILVFIAPLVCLKIVAVVIANTMPSGMFGIVDRILGSVYGFARGAAVVSLVYIGLSVINDPENHPVWIQEAQLLPYVRDGAELLAEWVPDDILTAETWDALPSEALGSSPASADTLSDENLQDAVDQAIEDALPEETSEAVR